jgi:hypothetical protein
MDTGIEINVVLLVDIIVFTYYALYCFNDSKYLTRF